VPQTSVCGQRIGHVSEGFVSTTCTLDRGDVFGQAGWLSASLRISRLAIVAGPPTLFPLKCAKNDRHPDERATLTKLSQKIPRSARKRDDRYIPPELLEAFGFQVKVDDG
jgi:hypothetical protein